MTRARWQTHARHIPTSAHARDRTTQAVNHTWSRRSRKARPRKPHREEDERKGGRRDPEVRLLARFRGTSGGVNFLTVRVNWELNSNIFFSLSHCYNNPHHIRRLRDTCKGISCGCHLPETFLWADIVTFLISNDREVTFVHCMFTVFTKFITSFFFSVDFTITNKYIHCMFIVLEQSSQNPIFFLTGLYYKK